MKKFFSAFALTLLISSATFAQVVIIGGGSGGLEDTTPVHMAKMQELQEAFTNAQPATADDLHLGKELKCVTHHYYRDSSNVKGKFVLNENNEITSGSGKKYNATEKGLIAEYQVDGWDYDYTSYMRKSGSDLIIEVSINPLFVNYQFPSLAKDGYGVWGYSVCSSPD